MTDAIKAEMIEHYKLKRYQWLTKINNALADRDMEKVARYQEIWTEYCEMVRRLEGEDNGECL